MTNTLQNEIINILITEWLFTEAAAHAAVNDRELFDGFAASRRKWHFQNALGKVDEFTPSFPHVSPGEAVMFESDEAVRYWLSRQTPEGRSPNDQTTAIDKRRSRRARHPSHARQRRQSAHAPRL